MPLGRRGLIYFYYAKIIGIDSVESPARVASRSRKLQVATKNYLKDASEYCKQKIKAKWNDNRSLPLCASCCSCCCCCNTARLLQPLPLLLPFACSHAKGDLFEHGYQLSRITGAESAAPHHSNNSSGNSNSGNNNACNICGAAPKKQ